jgi:hypothetical protein
MVPAFVVDPIGAQLRWPAWIRQVRAGGKLEGGSLSDGLNSTSKVGAPHREVPPPLQLGERRLRRQGGAMRIVDVLNSFPGVAMPVAGAEERAVSFGEGSASEGCLRAMPGSG